MVEDLVSLLSEKVREFYLDHKVYPNAILLSVNDIITLGGIDRSILKLRLPTIMSLIPLESSSLYDMPMPVLLPVVATKLQRARAIILENKDF